MASSATSRLPSTRCGGLGLLLRERGQLAEVLRRTRRSTANAKDGAVARRSRASRSSPCRRRTAFERVLQAEAAVLLAGVPDAATAFSARSSAVGGAHALTHQVVQHPPGVGRRGGLLDGLPEEVVDPRQQGDRAVGVGSAARGVGADLDQLADVAVRGQQPAQPSTASPRCSGVVIAVTTREIDSSTSMLGKWPLVASRRDSTMWPSRMERAVSPIGSCMSSPSTSTV